MNSAYFPKICYSANVHIAPWFAIYVVTIILVVTLTGILRLVIKPLWTTDRQTDTYKHDYTTSVGILFLIE
jgi:hypothetical protein